jgi:thiosulfate/3-mercaptopyruvate sulfurtransferase
MRYKPFVTGKMIFGLLASVLFACQVHAQNPVNWTAEQLMEPETLAAKLKSGENLPVIFSVGPAAVIPHSIDMQAAHESQNLEALRKRLSGMSRDTPVVVYCGCCPFEHCPNVRPAIQLLKDMQFTNYKLLNLQKNIKADWIDKGYPAVKL